MRIDVIGYKVDPMLSQFLSLYERSISQFYNEKHDSRYWGNILIFYSVERPQIASKGTFKNDVMQLGGPKWCDTRSKGASKTAFLVSQREKGVRNVPNLHDVIYEWSSIKTEFE